jgi:Rad3-related DNA helicase
MADPAGGGLETEPIDPDHGDLFFPKPFNDEQVQIIRRLEKADGLVVQGPPGTGKTHTIANIISHMLATGRRVLVVSHGETALSVIRDQLPEGVRDLAISVTTSEREGLKQVEKAIGLMLDIVNRIDASHAKQRNLIHALETNIVKNREQLRSIDARLADIATTHLSPLPGSSEKPYEMARRVIEERPAHEWFTDRPDRPFADTGIGETAIAALFAARKRVGAELEFRRENLPSPANLPDPATLLNWHHDLLRAHSLKDKVAPSEPQLRRVIARVGSEDAEKLASSLEQFAKSIAALMQAQWAWSLAERQKSDSAAMDRIRPTALSFLSDAHGLVERRRMFVAKPVDLPKELPPRPHRSQIFNKLAEGKNPFGPLAFGLNKHKEIIGQIRVKGLPPAGVDDWRHVRTYVAFRENLVSLSSRWIALRDELSVSVDVHFGDEHQAALDSIVVSLQAALVDIPEASKQMAERLEHARKPRRSAVNPSAS